MARNLKKVKNETQTLYNMEHGRKTWIMARNTKNAKNEKCTP
ncbi:hypothetical protein T09_8580 [Trichinella sp. T9]|nr:hypothetical protein T09_8580 [Trichinella sp. T9]